MRPAHQGRVHQTGVCPQQSQQKLHLPSRHVEVVISYIRTDIRSSKLGNVLTINVGRNEELGGHSRGIRVPKLTPEIFEFPIKKGKDEKAHTNKAREDQEAVSRMRNGRMSEVEYLLTEAHLDDWDGEGALALSVKSVEKAVAFLRACPVEAFLEEIDYAADATGDGEVMLTWAVGYDSLVTVLITREGELLHSGVFATSDKERKGVSEWVDTEPLPEGIIPCFKRLAAVIA